MVAIGVALLTASCRPQIGVFHTVDDAAAVDVARDGQGFVVLLGSA